MWEASTECYAFPGLWSYHYITALYNKNNTIISKVSTALNSMDNQSLIIEYRWLNQVPFQSVTSSHVGPQRAASASTCPPAAAPQPARRRGQPMRPSPLPRCICSSLQPSSAVEPGIDRPPRLLFGRWWMYLSHPRRPGRVENLLFAKSRQ